MEEFCDGRCFHGSGRVEVVAMLGFRLNSGEANGGVDADRGRPAETAEDDRRGATALEALEFAERLARRRG